MELSQEEEQMLGGKFGSAVQRAMEMLVAVGETYGAQRMVKITGAHLVPPDLQFWTTGELARWSRELVMESLEVFQRATAGGVGLQEKGRVASRLPLVKNLQHEEVVANVNAVKRFVGLPGQKRLVIRQGPGNLALPALQAAGGLPFPAPACFRDAVDTTPDLTGRRLVGGK